MKDEAILQLHHIISAIVIKQALNVTTVVYQFKVTGGAAARNPVSWYW